MNPTPARLLMDTNVIFDWLLDRHPYVDAGQKFWDARDAGRAILYMPASALTDIFYVVNKPANTPTAFAAIGRCLATLEIITVDRAILERARALPGSDFEDNVIIACAEAENLDAIITRDAKGFKHSSIQAIDPTTLP